MEVFQMVIFQVEDRKVGGGGLMIYVRSDIHFVRVKYLKGITPEEWAVFRTETIILKVKLGRGWIAIVGVYRPPSIPKHQWTRELSSIFEEVSTLTETVFYAGDFNADLLNPYKPPKDGRNLLDLMEIFGLDCLITKATRKTKTSETLLDLILTSNKKKTLVSDVVDTQISDHSLVFTILRSRAPRSRSRKICVRSFKNFNRDKFIQDLQMAPFSIVEVFDEVDDKLYAFEQLYYEILNEHAPLKQTIVRGNQVPYMTEQWRKAIRHRNKLWRLFMRDRTDANYDHYKIQRNICTSLRRKAIKEHFMKKSSEPENPREFWNAYRPFLHGKTKQANDIIIKENNVVINDKREIPELFNAHFIQITDGVPLMKETDYGQHFENHPSIKAIHEKNSAKDAPLCFNFEHINQAQVEKALLDVNVRKSCGHDMLSPRLVKESASVIAKPIINILNTSVEQGCYPNAWKMGQVTPLFKKDDESNKAKLRAT